MKRAPFIFAITGMIFLAGCLVSSLHPFYKPQDKIFDPILAGNWIDADSSVWLIEENFTAREFLGLTQPDSSYRITYYEDSLHKSVLRGTLFRLDGINFVDFFPDPDYDHFDSDMTGYHMIPVHTLARVTYNRDSILLYWYGEDWLSDLFEQNRIRIPHETIEGLDYDRHVLTASTTELQKFIRKYAADPEMLADMEEIFKKGSTDDQTDYGVFLKLKPYDGPVPE